jgi:SAM-dependent methyltransferase
MNFMKKLAITLSRIVAQVISVYPLAIWRYLTFYIPDLIRYRMMSKEHMPLIDSYPMVHDKTSSHPIDKHYFRQDVWALHRILASGPGAHVDIGSRLIVAGALSASMKVTYVDIRALNLNIPNLVFKAGDILNLPFEDVSLESVSCLHVAEHIGLGRYGDPLDPKGTIRAAKELSRVLKPGGTLYFSLPIGRPRVCFNAHRVHTPSQILDYFSDLQLIEFSVIADDGSYKEKANHSAYDSAEFGCGLFRFTKRMTNKEITRNAG